MDENISKKIRDDLILFKNETLKDIKESEKILLEKYRDIEYTIKEKIDNIDKQYMKFKQRIIEITAFIDNLKEIKNSINILIAHKTKSENSMIDFNIKLNNLEQDSNKSFFNIYNILKDSVIYPGIIGGSSKFKTFHIFIDYVLSNISQYNIFKEKISSQVNDNRTNIENIKEKFRTQLETIFDKTSSLINNEIISSEKKTHSILNLYDEKLVKFKNEQEKNNLYIKKEIDKIFFMRKQ